MEKDNTSGKIVLIKDLERYHNRLSEQGFNRVNVRVLGKIIKLVPKKTICDYIAKYPNSSEKDFWKTIISQTETQKMEFDNIYGVILYQNELFLIEAEQILMQFFVKEGSVYFFIGELEETKFSFWTKLILKPKIAINADNLNLHLFEQVVNMFNS